MIEKNNQQIEALREETAQQQGRYYQLKVGNLVEEQTLERLKMDRDLFTAMGQE